MVEENVSNKKNEYKNAKVFFIAIIVAILIFGSFYFGIQYNKQQVIKNTEMMQAGIELGGREAVKYLFNELSRCETVQIENEGQVLNAVAIECLRE